MTTYDTEWIMTRTATITGTRSTGHRPLSGYAELFSAYIGPFADKDTHFYVGGARGIDSMALLWLAGQTASQITVVVPATVDQQPAEARQAIATVQARIAVVVELASPELTSCAYHARNRWMVDRSGIVIGFPLEAEPESGTWQTLNYAAEQRKPRLIVPV